MKQTYPGTIIEKTNKTAGEFLFSIFALTKGLTLAQVREITGLDTPAIQNWVNRGWVAHPVEKRYSVEHLARILIINMLRDVMRFEAIGTVLNYINGDADDKSDDIISESKLYSYICDAVEKNAILQKVVSDYTPAVSGAKERLITALEIIMHYYKAAQMRKSADELFSKTFN